MDLDEAFVLDREALEIRPLLGHVHRSMSLCNLAVRLFTRYNQLGVLDDLDEAIDREALALRPLGNIHRSISLNNLGILLSTRYNNLGAMADLDEAILLDREALELRPLGHIDRSESLNNLEIRLSTGTTSSEGWLTSKRPLYSTENHRSFAHRGTSTGRRL